MSNNTVRDVVDIINTLADAYDNNRDKIDGMLKPREVTAEAQLDEDKESIFITVDANVKSSDEVDVEYKYTDNVLKLDIGNNSMGVDIPKGYRPSFDGEVSVNNGVVNINIPIAKKEEDN